MGRCRACRCKSLRIVISYVCAALHLPHIFIFLFFLYRFPVSLKSSCSLYRCPSLPSFLFRGFRILCPSCVLSPCSPSAVTVCEHTPIFVVRRCHIPNTRQPTHVTRQQRNVDAELKRPLMQDPHLHELEAKEGRPVSVRVSVVRAHVLIFICSCAHVPMCSCAHVLICSCAHVLTCS